MTVETGPHPGETEISPGIYLSRPPTTCPVSQCIGSPTDTTDNPEFLQQEATRLRRSVELLLRSNQEMKDSDPDDPDFILAIQENGDVIERQLGMIRKMEERVRVLLGVAEGQVGSSSARATHCHSERVGGPDATGESRPTPPPSQPPPPPPTSTHDPMEEEGVYL